VIDLATLTNPFRDSIVQDAWQRPADVQAIHEDVFRACLAGIDSAARGVSDSLLVFGPAGSGKTHLLTRLQRHLVETAAQAPDRVLHCVFVFVRLQTNPNLLFQHVRRRFATDLMRRDQGVTQLQRLIAHQIGTKDGLPPRASVMAFRVLSKDDQDELTSHLAQVAQELALPRDLCVVLEHLVCGRFVRDGSAWLAGESLPDSALAELGVSSEVVDDREEQAREVVTALCRLAGETLPIVFCFDQVEALQRSLQDQDAFFRFGRMAADLSDADQNVFLITCIQSALVEQFRGSIREADRDRMAKREAILSPLSPEQVRALVDARVCLVPELEGATRSGEFHFPPHFVEDLCQLTPCVPRRVLNVAARRFEGLQRGVTLPVGDPKDFLRRECASRTAKASGSSSEADTTRILMQGLEPLAALSNVEVIQDPLRQADFGLQGEKRVFAEIRNEIDGRSLGPRLKRLLDNTPRSDGAQTVILRDPRIPIGKSATKVRERLAELSRRGVRVVEPTVAALGALAALSELLADAKSGDLANEGDPISGSVVLEWIRSLGSELAMEPVAELVSQIMADPAVVTPQDTATVDLAELLNRERVLTVESAATHLKITAGEVGEIARRIPERFLLLEGPPAVVLEVAGVTPEVTQS
jgi:hypothetical protein